jgi:hypothetical protein
MPTTAGTRNLGQAGDGHGDVRKMDGGPLGPTRVTTEDAER